MEFLIENTVSLKEGDNGQSQYARENRKVFENRLEKDPYYAKHAIFATGLSHKQVARNPCDKIFKNLSKCFSRLEFHS